MNAGPAPRRKTEPLRPPGDDEVPVPPPLKEEPPFDRFCDLVLTGGVASGVVYPWAIVELARAYRFRNIGGTSVGAMAAVLAAAAEYGRRQGIENSFEVLRRVPGSLAFTLPDGRTRMLSLFQPNAHGRRLVQLWGRLWNGNADTANTGSKPYRPEQSFWRRALGLTLRIYARPGLLGAAVGAVVTGALTWGVRDGTPWNWSAWVVLGALAGAVIAGLWALWSDIKRGLIQNFYGLCKGGTVTEPGAGEDTPTGLSEWLHVGIQLSAGLKPDDPPLTFRDLWTAPAYPGAAPQACGPDDPVGRRSINLQMITTNVTHGRPYRLPLSDSSSRLFFRRTELNGYFPARVLDALVRDAKPYLPERAAAEPSVAEAQALGLLELPVENLPVVVAARLSLSFPLLFSAVPLWAIDYEAPKAQRHFRRCLFTDGGVSSNFPIHLFDAAVPRWPTFGFWLDRRPPYHYARGRQDIWLPEFNDQGRGDSWNRFDPGSQAAAAQPAGPASRGVKSPEPCPGANQATGGSLFGFLTGIAYSAADWRDRTSFRMPHVRNRVVRLMLRPDEGGLHIGMPRAQILDLAHRYGTASGQAFVERFVDQDGQPSRAWLEQRWVRFNMLVNGLRELLAGVSTAAVWSNRSEPLAHAVKQAMRQGPVANHDQRHAIKRPQADALLKVLHAIEQLESDLSAAPEAFSSQPAPELRLRPPL